jgi:hypothetical protein
MYLSFYKKSTIAYRTKNAMRMLFLIAFFSSNHFVFTLSKLESVLHSQKEYFLLQYRL